MYVRHAPLFLGIGVLLIPLSIVISVLQAVVLGGFGLAGVDTTGESAGWLVLLIVAVGTILTLLGFALVQAATVCALVEVDDGREIGACRRTALPSGGFARFSERLAQLSPFGSCCLQPEFSFPSRSGSR